MPFTISLSNALESKQTKIKTTNNKDKCYTTPILGIKT